MKNLKILNLSNNKIQDVNICILQNLNLDKLFLSGNPIKIDRTFYDRESSFEVIKKYMSDKNSLNDLGDDFFEEKSTQIKSQNTIGKENYSVQSLAEKEVTNL